MLSHGGKSSLRLADRTLAFGPSPFNRANPDFKPELLNEIFAFIDLRLEVSQATKFLDVGCGHGAVMSRIKHQYPGGQLVEVAGIEIDPLTAKNARNFGQVFEMDARKFRAYGDYDVVFLYRPLIGRKEQSQLEEFIIGQLKPGSLVVSVKPATARLISPRYRIYEVEINQGKAA